MVKKLFFNFAWAYLITGCQLGLLGNTIIAVGGSHECSSFFEIGELNITQFYEERTDVWLYGPRMQVRRSNFGLATLKVAEIENKLSKLRLCDWSYDTCMQTDNY